MKKVDEKIGFAKIQKTKLGGLQNKTPKEPVDDGLKTKRIYKKRTEAISHELLGICVKNGLTIAEMIELSCIFPRLIREKINKMEQRTNFTLSDD